MSNITNLTEHRRENRKPLDWLARGLEARLKNDPSGETVMVIIDRAEAIKLVRLIDSLPEKTERKETT